MVNGFTIKRDRMRSATSAAACRGATIPDSSDELAGDCRTPITSAQAFRD
jgi:hypothetical protein